MTEIRLLTEEDFDSFLTIIRNAYPGETPMRQDKEKVKQYLLKVHREDPGTKFYAAYRNGKMVGGMRLHDFKMQFFESRVYVGGVGLVAVDLIHKKEKICKDLITYTVKHFYEKTASMVLLYPFHPDFYKKMGWEFGTKMNHYRISAKNIPDGGSKKHIHFLTKTDKQAVWDCYNRYLAKTQGMIERNDMVMTAILSNPENIIVGYKKGGQISGYAVFTFQPAKADNFILNDIYIKEFIYENQEALAELLTFFHTQADQINRVIFNTQDENFHLLIGDPRNGTENLTPPGFHECNTQGVGIMYRVINTPGLFNALSNYNFNNANLKLKIKIEDNFWPVNNKQWTVHFVRGRAKITKTKKYDVAISLKVNDFSALVVGAIDFQTLYKYGRVKISEANHIEEIDKIFRADVKPICMTAF